MRRLALVPLIIGVLLFPPVASALGLGEIEMQSALNQRLDAEIPLRGVDEDQSDAIIVTLASEEAFRQVGLQRPFSLTRLQFAVRRHDDGSYYVHVTSAEPIVKPFLSFLLEIDWPDGNLLREYTVLLDPPVFVSEPREAEAPAATSAAGDESTPAAGVPAAIERDQEPAPEPAAETAAAEPEPATEPVAEVEPPEGDFADTPVFLQAEQEDERAEAEARETAAAAEPEPAPEAEVTTATTRGYDLPGEYGPVERGEALWNIATRLKRADMSVQQMMLALLRYNRDAFINDNINLLKQGYVLRIPEADEVLSLSAQQAVAQVREHNALWQEFRTAARAGGAQQAVEAPAVEQPVAAGDEDAAGEDAGLKIVGSADGSGASSDESASATGNGDQPASEELKLAREQLESAQMEKEELQSRVSELEETVDKMERLIEVREDQLARLQDQLRKLQQEQEAAAAEAADDAAAEDDGAAAGATETDEATTAEEQTATSDDPGAAEEGDDTEVAAAATGDGGGSGSDTAAGDAGGEAAAGGDGATEATEATGGSDAAATQVADAGDTGTAAAEASGAGATSGESGVVTSRTQPAERGWMAQAMAMWDSVKGTVGGAVGGLTAGAGLGSLLQNPLTLPLAGAAVVLLLGGLLLARRRRAAGDEGALATGDEAAVRDQGAEDDPFAAMMQTESTDDVAVDEDTPESWDEDDTRTVAAGEAESALMSEDFNLDDLDEEDRAVAGADASEDDTIAEADVYLAYGLHQQAEDLLKLALQEHPDRLDYHAKMLEALYGAGKSEEFVTRAQEFRERVDNPGDELWLRAVAMGQDLAPGNALFQQEVDETLKPAATTAAAPETDLDVGGDEGGATDLDFSFEEDAGEPAEEDDDEFARTVMVDSDQLESRGGGAETAGGKEPAAAGDGDDMDFDLGELELGDDDSGPAAAAPTDSAETAGDEEGGLEFDLGDLDLGDAGDEDRPATTPASDEKETAEVDLGSLDVGDDDSAGGGEDDDSFDIDLGDLDSGGLETETESADDDSFDLGDFEIDSGAESEKASGEADEQSVSFEGDDDMSLTDLEGDFDSGGSAGGDEDELDTMLDLARAYIDMGDSESARAALEEVAEAGNEKQRGEAQSLLESV